MIRSWTRHLGWLRHEDRRGLHPIDLVGTAIRRSGLCHGHPAPGTDTWLTNTCPVRAATASFTCSTPRHSAASRNNVLRSGPPSIAPEIARSCSIRCSTSPPSRIRTTAPRGESSRPVETRVSPAPTQMAPSASMQMASGPRPSAQTRRLERLPSVAISNAMSRPVQALSVS